MKNSYLKVLWQSIRHEKTLMYLIAITSMLTTVCLLLLPIMTQYALDENILTLTKKPWYETSNSGGPTIDGLHLTQNQDDAVDIEKTIRVAYDEKEAYFVFDVPKLTEIGEIKAGIALSKTGEILDYKVLKLSKTDIQALYQPNIAGLYKIITIYLLVVLIHPLFAWLNNVFMRKFSRNIIADFRVNGMKKLQKLPIDYFAKKQDGKFISYLISDVSMFYSLASSVGIQILQAAIMFFGIYIMLFILDYRLFIGGICVLPMLYFWLYFYRKKINIYYEKARHSSSALNALLNEQFQGTAIINAFRYEEQACEEFDGLNYDVYAYNHQSLKLRSFSTGSAVNLIRRALWLAILIYAGLIYFDAGVIGLTIGTIYLLIAYVNYYVEPLYQVFSIITIVEQSNVSISRYFKYMAEPEEIERADAIMTDVARFSGEIRFDNVCFSYGSNENVLKNITFKVKPYQTVAIVGHTGSGKSSLMNIFLRFYDYDSGTIRVDGIEIKAMSRDVYRKHIGIILQDPILFKGTLYEAITMGDFQYSKADVEKLLAEIGAGDILDHPEKLEQPVSELGKNFSLGQRQLIAFARTIIQNPAIVVLDEATANIDSETEQKINNALKIGAEKRTTFIIAHRLSTIKDADSIIVLNKGAVVEKGTHTELIQKRGLYFEMYEAQSQIG
ncbi:multidrug ABC transporter permease [Erysipelotrichaceae bacterium]|nr:multidrug ABC transporter permease [Erysipelotrichaceae bacterium]